MRILQIHCDKIEYEPVKKEIASAEEVEKKPRKLEDVVVMFTAIEEGDDSSTAKQAIEDLKKYTDSLKIENVLIYPFAHLSRNLSKPEDAKSIMADMEKRAKDAGLNASHAPFGWNKRFSLSVKGHPMAEQSRSYGKGAEAKVEIKAKRKRPAESILKRSDFSGLSEKDHRIIGEKMDLFSFQEVAPGMAYFHPNGMVIRNELMNLSRSEQMKSGYKEVMTPMIINNAMWETSGHWDHYKDNMFFTKIDDADYGLKPMNCPNAIMVFKNTTRSYRDLPMKMMEFGTVSRNELSGVLSGLFRVRTMTQDDAHIFVTEDQLENEVENVIELIEKFYKIFGFDYHVELSTRPENSMGSDEMWEKAERALEGALKKRKMKFKVNKGDGAFYGPKIDFHIKDSMNRSWQLSTVQVDFQMAEKFGATYVGNDGATHTPVIIHRAIYGSLERFMGILIEHYEGKFPTWLAPIQAKVLSISNQNEDYAEKVYQKIFESGIRVEKDIDKKTIEYKVREAQMQRVPYTIVIGGKEEESKTIAVRGRDGKTKFKVKLEDFIEDVKKEIEEKR